MDRLSSGPVPCVGPEAAPHLADALMRPHPAGIIETPHGPVLVEASVLPTQCIRVLAGFGDGEPAALVVAGEPVGVRVHLALDPETGAWGPTGGGGLTSKEYWRGDAEEQSEAAHRQDVRELSGELSLLVGEWVEANGGPAQVFARADEFWHALQAASVTAACM